MADNFKIKNTVKYPTSLIIGGMSKLGLEIADSLIEQGGYVIVVDNYTSDNLAKLNIFPKDTLLSFVDYTALTTLDEDLRRLDYVFYFNHDSIDFTNKISTQEFLKFSNYLDAALALAVKFDAKFLLTTAIKAHQLSFTYDELSMNYGTTAFGKHSVYTEMEAERYAESLVVEYVEKTELDARILRLGEVIGDGIDFSKRSIFNDLVLSAAKGEALKLVKDGLESEWLVHLMDAAYGIIKAQFTKTTKGEIYSLAYEHPFSHLSIAYKIQDLESGSQEIQFIDEENNLPDIKLYKPAPNLSHIGWAPKLPFEKALKQSIAAGKIYLLEYRSTEKANEDVNVVSKLRGFLNLAEAKESSEEYSGPISRLIAERKKQEDLKKEKMAQTSDILKVKRKEKKGFAEQTVNTFWNFSGGLGNSFAFLKNKSPLELVGKTALLIIAVLFFILIFSPIVIIVKNVLILIPQYNSAVAAIENGRYSELPSDFETPILEINNELSKFEGVAKVLGVDKQFYQLKTTLGAYYSIADGISNISYGLVPLQSYIDNFVDNTQVRAGGESYLTVIDPGLDYENVLLDLKDKVPYLDIGIDKYKKGLAQLAGVDYKLLPGFLSERALELHTKAFAFEESINLIATAKYIPDLLGVYETRTYLILLHDNTRLKPVQGEISAYALITMKNGAIIDIVVQSPDEVDFDFEILSGADLTEINKRKFTPESLKDINYQDLGSIYNYPVYASVLETLYSDKYDKEVSMVISLDYSVFDQLLQKLASKTEAVSLNLQTFSGGDFLDKLELLQTGSPTLNSKHNFSAQLLAQTLHKLFENPKENLSLISTVLFNQAKENDVLLEAPNLSYSEFIEQNNFNSSRHFLSDAFLTVGYSIEDPKIIYSNKYPSFNFTDEIIVSNEFELFLAADIQIPLLGATQEVSLCMPATMDAKSVKVKGIDSSRIVINNSNSEKCIVMKVLSESQVAVNWELTKLFDQEALEQNIEIGLGKIRGAYTLLDYNLTLEPELSFINITPPLTAQNNRIIFTRELSSDLVVKLFVSKPPL